MSHMLRRALVAFALLGVARAPSADQGATFGATSNLVSVYATVTGADGQYVRNLTARDFRVFDNDAPAPIDVFSNDMQPITVAVLVDESGSMLRRLPRVRAAAEAFVGRLVPRDRASFSTLTHAGAPLTADTRALTLAIRAAADWPYWDTGSPIWGALDHAMTELAAERGRRVLVIITDGLDTPIAYRDRSAVTSKIPRIVFRPTTGSDIAERAAREGFMLYAIGFEGAPLEDDIKTIARQSGGGWDLIGANEDLSAAFTGIVDDLHRQYLIGFAPAALDGATHRIEVRCLAPNTTVRARETYLADTR
jgi:VWFA-related protein